MWAVLRQQFWRQRGWVLKEEDESATGSDLRGIRKSINQHMGLACCRQMETGVLYCSECTVVYIREYKKNTER